MINISCVVVECNTCIMYAEIADHSERESNYAAVDKN